MLVICFNTQKNKHNTLEECFYPLEIVNRFIDQWIDLELYMEGGERQRERPRDRDGSWISLVLNSPLKLLKYYPISFLKC